MRMNKVGGICLAPLKLFMLCIPNIIYAKISGTIIRILLESILKATKIDFYGGNSSDFVSHQEKTS